jgi:hypothetical protein
MKVIAKVFLFIGLLFWGLGLIYSLSKLIALNGLGNLFDMESPNSIFTRIERDSLDINIYYAYKVEEKEYSSEYNMFAEYFNRCNVDTIIIKYNTIFPMISYIEGVPLKIRKQKTGIFISSFFVLFLLLIWRFSNKDKWVKAYEEVGDRPWLYPDNKTIKNPWKRLLNKLFKKGN